MTNSAKSAGARKRAPTEQKAITLKAKQIDGRVVTGFASVFGVLDSYNDVTHPGAFVKTLKENSRRIRHLWMHNMMEPPTAAIKDIREVGRDELPAELLAEHPEATGGLLVAREYLDTPRGNEILAGLKSDPPAIEELSFGYDAIKYDFTEMDGPAGKFMVRNLREVRLYDTSDVTWGANAATLNLKSLLDGGDTLRLYQLALAQLAACDLSQKSREADMWLVVAAVAENILHKDYPTSFEASEPDPEGDKQGRVLSSANLDRLKNALAVLTEILTAAEPPSEQEQDTDSASAKALTERRASLIQRALTEAALSKHI